VQGVIDRAGNCAPEHFPGCAPCPLWATAKVSLCSSSLNQAWDWGIERSTATSILAHSLRVRTGGTVRNLVRPLTQGIPGFELVAAPLFATSQLPGAEPPRSKSHPEINPSDVHHATVPAKH